MHPSILSRARPLRSLGPSILGALVGVWVTVAGTATVHAATVHSVAVGVGSLTLVRCPVTNLTNKVQDVSFRYVTATDFGSPFGTFAVESGETVGPPNFGTTAAATFVYVRCEWKVKGSAKMYRFAICVDTPGDTGCTVHVPAGP
jgi:hypothetical protein